MREGQIHKLVRARTTDLGRATITASSAKTLYPLITSAGDRRRGFLYFAGHLGHRIRGQQGVRIGPRGAGALSGGNAAGVPNGCTRMFG